MWIINKGTGSSGVGHETIVSGGTLRFMAADADPLTGDMGASPLIWNGEAVPSFPRCLFLKLQPPESGYSGDLGEFKNFRIFGGPVTEIKAYFKIQSSFSTPSSNLYGAGYSAVPATDPGASSPNIPLPSGATTINLDSTDPQTQFVYVVIRLESEPSVTGTKAFTLNFAWQQTV